MKHEKLFMRKKQQIAYFPEGRFIWLLEAKERESDEGNGNIRVLCPIEAVYIREVNERVRNAFDYVSLQKISKSHLKNKNIMSIWHSLKQTIEWENENYWKFKVNIVLYVQ